jgi:hypothetical protein
MPRRPPQSAEPPLLDAMMRMVAGLGGFLNRKCDCFPAPQTFDNGPQRDANGSHW